jgi:muconate cycloisomerase
MKLEFKTIYLPKRFPLRISRGTSSGSDNLFVTISHDGITGIGEMAPGDTEGADTPAAGMEALSAFWQGGIVGKPVREVHAAGIEAGVAPCALCALDIALWDWLGKRAGLPLYRMLGLGKARVPTSVTVGINPPEVVRERVPLLLNGTGVRSLKIKLGSPDGIEADQAMFSAVVEASTGYDVVHRVDANGGWSLADARRMMTWLAGHGVEYIEQPLVKGAEDQLPELYRDRAMPIFVDESCRFASDIPAWAGAVDGVNLKLMKCGGITGALDIVAVARAFGLQTMIGCMGESSISISAGAALGALFDHIDLDSHLNLNPDPATGAELIDGVLVPTEQPGHGGRLRDA